MKEEILLLEYKKRCPCCGEYGGKDGCGFYKNKSKKDGLQDECIVCMREAVKKYKQSERGRQTQGRYEQSEHIKQYRKYYRQSEHGKRVRKQYQKRYKQSEKGKELRQSEYWKQYDQKYGKQRVVALVDSYIKQLIRSQDGTKTEDTTPEDILIKREQIQTKRVLKRLRKEMKL